MSHFCTHFPQCRQHLASSFLSLLIYFCSRGGGRIPRSSYRMCRGASHVPLSAPFCDLFSSERIEFGKSVLHKLSWWQPVSVKRISRVHVVILLLFVCFVQICAQYKHPRARMQTHSGVDYITPQVCFAPWCHRPVVCFVHSSTGQTKHD